MLSEISLKLLFAILAILAFVGGGFLPYIRDIFLKKTQPHVYSWLIWVITQGTAVAGLWYGNGGWGTIIMVISVTFVFFVFLLSLKYGTRNITKGDTILLVASFLAIVVWWQLHNPLLAVVMVSIIDFVGYFPSYRKTFAEPWTETPFSWMAFSVANIFGMLALSQYNLLTLTYLITITIANVILLIICLLRRRVVSHSALI